MNSMFLKQAEIKVPEAVKVKDIKCEFRMKVDTDFGIIWTPISELSGRAFR